MFDSVNGKNIMEMAKMSDITPALFKRIGMNDDCPP